MVFYSRMFNNSCLGKFISKRFPAFTQFLENMGQKSSKTINVLVIGGSFSGISTAQELVVDKNFNVVLVEPKDYFEYTPSILRAMAKPSKVSSVIKPLTGFICFSTLRALVCDITELRNAEQIDPGTSFPHSQIPGNIVRLLLVNDAGFIVSNESDYKIYSERAEVSLSKYGMKVYRDSPFEITNMVKDINPCIDVDDKFSIYVQCDLTIIATGSKYASPVKADFMLPSSALERTKHSLNASITSAFGPFSMQYRKQTLQRFSSTLKELSNKSTKQQPIHIFGSGLVGVELAAELHHFYPELPVQLHAKDNTILDNFHPYLQKKCKQFLEQRTPTDLESNVKIVYNSVYNENTEKQMEDSLGVFSCIGVIPNSFPLYTALNTQDSVEEFMNKTKKHTCSRSIVHDGKGYFNITSTFHVYFKNQDDGSPSFTLHSEDEEQNCFYSTFDTHFHSIFALGDVSKHNTNLIKMAYVAEVEGHALSYILRDISKKSQNIANKTKFQTVKYPSCSFGPCEPPLLCSISLGPNNGVLVFNDIHIPGYISSFSKLFIEQTKLLYVQENFLCEAIWCVADPVVTAFNIVYRFFQQRK